MSTCDATIIRALDEAHEQLKQAARNLLAVLTPQGEVEIAAAKQLEAKLGDRPVDYG